MIWKVAGIIFSSLVCVICQAATIEMVKISAHPEFPPLMYKSGNRIVGVLPTIVADSLNHLGKKVTSLYLGPWARVQLEAEAGGIDAIAGIYLNDERLRYLEFVMVPLIENPSVVFVKKEKKFKFNSWQSLEGRKIGTLIGDKYSVEFEQFLEEHKSKINIERVKTLEQLFQMLKYDRIDTIIYSKYVGELVLKKVGLNNEIVSLEPPVFSGKFYFAISKKSPLLAEKAAIEKAIKKTKAKIKIESLVKENSEEYLKIKD